MVTLKWFFVQWRRNRGRAWLGSVVRRPDSAIHWIAMFSTIVKLAVDRYNLRLRFGIYKLKFVKIYCRVQIRSFTALRLVLQRLHYPLSGG